MQGESLDPNGPKDPKEAFNIAPPNNQTLQPLPPPLSTHTALLSRFQQSCHTLCTTILSLLGTALDIPDPTYFASRHDESRGPSGTIFRLLYYPKTITKTTTPNTPSIRAGAHSDYGTLTLLFRLPGQPGLELLTPTAGWLPVPVNPSSSSSSSSSSPSPYAMDPPPILVNIGDLLSFWTRGLLKSTVHRVVFSGGGEEEERYSMAYFCHPLDEVRLEGLPSRVIEEFGERGAEELRAQRERLGLGLGGKEEEEEGGEVLTARGHLERRLRVTYGI